MLESEIERLEKMRVEAEGYHKKVRLVPQNESTLSLILTLSFIEEMLVISRKIAESVELMRETNNLSDGR